VESSFEAAVFADFGKSFLFTSDLFPEPLSAGIFADPVSDVGREQTH